MIVDTFEIFSEQQGRFAIHQTSQQLYSQMQQNKETEQAAAKNSAQDNRGRSIGNYILGKTIGEGTFGKVKLGTHSLTGQKVAIKVLEKSRIIDVADVERVSREIHILKLIRHPNIIQLYEIIETPKQLFLVMQYVSDGQLFDYIVKKKKIKEQQACEFMHQILAGVEYLHKLSIVHRDLKPENLLIDFNRRIKLVDFGLSNTYKKNELLKTACGSPCYAAPEMIAGKKYEGLNVDVWSCGVILFAMVCGYLPFEDPNTSALYKKILAGDYTIPKFVSSEARELIKGILTTDPEKRLTLKDIKNHRWMAQARLPTQCEGLIIGYHRVPVDMTILQSLKDFSFDVQSSRKYLQSNRHNHTTTTYYLILKKNLKNGSASNSDICSQNFDKKSMDPAPKKKDKIALTAEEMFSDQLDLDPDLRRKKIVSQLTSRRQSDKMTNMTISTTAPTENLPVVKQKMRRTMNRFNRFNRGNKQNTIDVNLYDFDDLNEVSNTNTQQISPVQTLDLPRSNLFHRTKPLFRNTRYGSISSRDQSMDGKDRRRISIRENDLNKTFRITKNTFQIRNVYGSIDAKTTRRTIHTRKSQQDDSLRNVLANLNLKRGSRNYNL